MKNKGIVVPVVLSGIMLILVIATALNQNVFKRTPSQTLQKSKSNRPLMGSAAIASMTAGQFVVVEIGSVELPAIFPSSSEVKSVAFNGLLSAENKALFSDNKKKKVLIAVNIADAAKAWTLLTSMGYDEIYVFDPDEKSSPGQNDSIQRGNEELRYSFKPEKPETE